MNYVTDDEAAELNNEKLREHSLVLALSLSLSQPPNVQYDGRPNGQSSELNDNVIKNTRSGWGVNGRRVIFSTPNRRKYRRLSFASIVVFVDRKSAGRLRFSVK